MKKWFKVVLVAIVVLTPSIVIGTNEDRGYFAIGGELLLLPVAVILKLLIDSLKQMLGDVITGCQNQSGK